MKEFFKSELQTLKAKTGLNQYETFSNMPDAAKQIGILLDSMVLACNEFPYIPDMDKCLIIQKMIIQDQDFTALNSRAVWKWLNMHKDVYWGKIKTEEEKPVEYPPLTEEEKAELDKELLRRKAEAMAEKTKFPGLDLTMKAIEAEDKERTEKKRGTPDPRPVFVVDVKDEEGNVIETVENVKASTPEKAQEIATDYVRKKYKI